MSLNNLGLGFVFTARDLASGTIQRVGAGFGALDRNALRAQQSYARNFAVLGAGLGLMGAGAATLAGAFALAQDAGHFEQEVARVGAITRATSADMQRLHDAAIAAGIATQFSPNEAIEGLGVLGQQGFNTASSIRLLTPTLDLAAGGMITVEQAAEAVTNATHVFGLSMDDAAGVANQLLRITNSTALSAGELGLAMGTVARGSRQTHQGIEEMLPAIGLLRNTGLDASTAAQSVSSALTFMSSRAGQIRQTLGVELVETLDDGTQRFRPFMDIVQEAGEALETRFANPAERTAVATELFSRFGVGAVTGVFEALKNGVTDSQGVVHRGADAIRFLRNEMLNADGAAEEFRNRLLDTFEGQQVLLRGSMETLRIVIGEGFTRAFRPVVEGILAVVNKTIEFIQGIPVEVRGAIGQAIMIFGGLLSALGAFVAAGAAIAIIAPFIKAIALAAGGLLLAMAPLVLTFAALGGAIYVVHRLAQENAGVARTLSRAWDAVRLTFLGLSQAVTEGGFSGEVRRELRQAENLGIRRFVLQVAGIGFRIVQFFRGIGIGFQAALDRMGPSINVMLDAFQRLGEALGLVTTNSTKAVSSMPSERFAAVGARIGTFLGGVVDVTVKLLTIAAEVANGVVQGWGAVTAKLQPVFDGLGPSFAFLGEQMDRLLATFGALSDEQQENASGWQTFGRILGGAVAIGIGTVVALVDSLALTLGAVVWAVGSAVAAFRQMWTWGQLLGLSLTRAFHTAADAILDMIDLVIVGHAEMARAIPAQFRPAALDDVIQAGDAANARITARDAEARVRDRALTSLEANARRGPAAAEASARADRDAANAHAIDMVAEMVRKQAAERQQQVINLQVDGETILAATVNAERRDGAASFAPVGAER